jgi:cytochrome o ubiquinol oxidase subunit IV
MSHIEPLLHPGDISPGDERPGGREIVEGVLGYLVGLGLAALITAVAFYIAHTSLVWHPSIPIALFVLAVAQMGVHLVFFIHLTTGPDNTNNVLALAFGVMIVALVLVGSLWIMAHLNQNMMPPGMMDM